MARTIQSPGVQISEVDLSLAASFVAPTNILIPGFAPKGPSSSPITVSSLSEFEQVFGTPTNAAERYFYQTTKAVFQAPANVTVYRLPYGTGAGLGTANQYSALVYPVVTAQLSATSTGIQSVTSTNLNYAASASGITYLFGAPTHISLSEYDFLNIQRGNAFNWSTSAADAVGNPVTTFNSLTGLGTAGLIVLNDSQASINSRFEGTYVGIADNTALNRATQYDDFNNIASINTTGFVTPTSYINVPPQRLTFALSATNAGITNSVSQVVENISTFDTSGTAFNDTINLGVFKLRQSVFSPDTIQLDYVLQEGYNASLDYYRQINNRNGGPAISYFLDTVDSGSSNIATIVNPYVSNKNTTSWLNLSGVPNKSVRFLNSARSVPFAFDTISSGLTGVDTYATRTGVTSATYTALIKTYGDTAQLFPLGEYTVENVTTKVIGNVPTKVNSMLNSMANADLFPLSIVCEAGLGTVYANSFNPATSGYFDDSVPYSGTDFTNLTAQDGSGQNATVAVNYQAVAQQFVNFASLQRKDHLFIADPLTNIFVQNGVKTLTDPNNNFSTNIFWPLYNLMTPINNSYTVSYANCVQVPDQSSSRNVWVPFSGFAAANMSRTDSNYQPWYAPAGFTRGVVAGASDIAVYPNQKQRDQLYNVSLNPVAFFPNEGFVVYGQKTMSKLPSAFDRINVRRLFLTLENQTNAVARNYVFEPNTLFTRTQVLNVLTPIFNNAKNTSGIYDYLIVCDERNNTPAVIDDNSLVIDIYIKPVRTAEFILVNFYATRTNQNFSEIVA
jgi:Phage tail sheath protein subtilisin-like domain/Phage tail sheath C-terminal domain